MSRKKGFPKEGDTKPAIARPKLPEVRRSGPAPKTKRELAEAPTLPPPPLEPPEEAPVTRQSGRASAANNRNPGARPRKPVHASATVDEVTADLSKDPRREVDDD